MSRSFNGTSDLISLSKPVLTGWNCTLSAWVTTAVNDGVQRTILSLGNTADTNPLTRIAMSSSNTAFCQSRGAGTGASAAAGSVTLTTNTWFHICGTITVSGIATVYTNGLDKTAGGNPAETFPVFDNTTAGDLRRTTDSLFWSGNIADAAVWSAILSDQEIYALAHGARPHQIRPGSISLFWPFDGYNHPALDYSTYRRNGILTGTGFAAGPPLITPLPIRGKFWPGIDALGWLPEQAAAATGGLGALLSSERSRIIGSGLVLS